MHCPTTQAPFPWKRFRAQKQSREDTEALTLLSSTLKSASSQTSAYICCSEPRPAQFCSGLFILSQLTFRLLAKDLLLSTQGGCGMPHPKPLLTNSLQHSRGNKLMEDTGFVGGKALNCFHGFRVEALLRAVLSQTSVGTWGIPDEPHEGREIKDASALQFHLRLLFASTL